LSQLLGPRGGFTVQVLVDNEDRIHDPVYFYNVRAQSYNSFGTYGRWGYGFYDVWKRPTLNGMASDGAPSIIDTFYQNYTYWPWEKRPGGSQNRYMVFGYCLNAAAQAISGATIQLVDITSNQVMDTVTSQADGRFDVGSPFTSNCYVTGYKAGSPNLAGMSDTTIVP